jgi:LAS superfamily LD-carboxypeptidase LdcB
MLTIGATANSKVVGENSTALSKFNAGLTDRFKEQVVQSEEDLFKSNLEEFNEKLSESQELYNKFKTLLKDYANYLIGLSQGKFDPSDAETYKDALTSYLTYYQQYRQAQYQVNYAIKFKKRPPPLFAPNTGFIPFNLSITMDGLSGMKIYSKFLIDVDFLPTNYPENADFLIKGIHHVIENNKWFTTLESIVISKGGTDPSMFGKNKASVRVTGTADSIEAASLLPPPLQNFSPPSNKVGSSSYSFSPLARYIASQGYTNGRLPDNSSLLVVINDNVQRYQQTFKLHPSAAKAYSQWAKAAKSAGFTWTVSSAYRDFAKQASLGKGKTVAGPGSSAHGWAGALDFSELYRAVGGSGKPAINSSVRQTNVLYKWMAENGPKFGWYNPYRLADGNGTDEVWHWEYWGNV